MTTRRIIELPDHRLREVSERVDIFDTQLQRLIDDLLATLSAHGGIGLCAPQIGTLKRVAVIHVPGDNYGQQVYINPEILASARRGFVEESCLSVPGIVGNVFRATQVHVRAQNSEGEFFEQEVDGMHAVCLQHEIDHLDGKLFIDRLSWLKKLRLKMAARATEAA
ncbi:MAG: peptide deformylase [Congregibacter sp.]